MSVLIRKFSQTFGFQWLISFVICLLVHVPYFLGKHCSFDGDEAIVGVMAQDLLHGRNVPVFFYGQQYGFSFFEVIGVAIAMIFFGSTVWSLKIGSLLVFSIGIAFLFRLFSKNKIALAWTIIAIIIISCFPAWIVWSAKARGGYVTAFSAVCILFYLIRTKKADLNSIIISGLIFSVALHSQLIIASCISFLWIGWILRTKKLGWIFLAGISVIIFYFLLKIPAWANSNYWTVPFTFNYHYSNIFLFVRESYKAALGYFYYEMTFKPRVESLFLGAGYYLVAAISAALFFIRTKEHRGTFILLLLGSLVAFFMIMGMRIPTHRYFLGMFTGIMLIMVLGMVEVIKNKKLWRYIFLLMLPLGLGFVNTSKHIPDAWMLPEGNDMKLYNELLVELKNHHINHVFVTDGLLQWMLCYSGVPARYISKEERINRFLNKVDQCYLDPECETAIVGFKGYYNYMDTGDWNNRVIIVNDKYFIYIEPDLETLKQGGYELNLQK
jgi:hypothetical protein